MPLSQDDTVVRDLKHRCPYCQKMFRTIEDLSTHIVTRHSQSKIGRITPRPVKKDA
jgi:uncharacterized C2H2 Zn-finger protein